MALFAPSGVHDTPPLAGEDAVIKEARRRARRRRVHQGIAVAAVGAAVVAALAIRASPPPRGGGSPAPHRTAASASPTSPHRSPSGAARGELGAVHVGWVLVYDDGRVLSSPDGYPVLERRLTPSGVAAVRAGSVTLYSLLSRSQVMTPASIWVDSEGREYRPAAYAACLWANRNHAGEVRAMPAAARKVLSGAPPARVGHAGTHSRVAASDVTSAWNCLRIDSAELAALERAAARVDRWGSGDDIVFARTTDGSRVKASIWPIMPHGRWIVWGG